jgi:hypothetical protein
MFQAIWKKLTARMRPRPRCEYCEKQIRHGELVARLDEIGLTQAKSPKWIHLSCLRDKCTAVIKLLKEET